MSCYLTEWAPSLRPGSTDWRVLRSRQPPAHCRGAQPARPSPPKPSLPADAACVHRGYGSAHRRHRIAEHPLGFGFLSPAWFLFLGVARLWAQTTCWWLGTRHKLGLNRCRDEICALAGSEDPWYGGVRSAPLNWAVEI